MVMMCNERKRYCTDLSGVVCLPVYVLYIHRQPRPQGPYDHYNMNLHVKVYVLNLEISLTQNSVSMYPISQVFHTLFPHSYQIYKLSQLWANFSFVFPPLYSVSLSSISSVSQ